VSTPNDMYFEGLNVWSLYSDQYIDWPDLVKNITPKDTPNGLIYELPMKPDAQQSIAIADMRQLPYAEPHYHTNGEQEMYIVLAGLGRVVVGGVEQPLEPGTISVTPPETAHFTVPTVGLVLAVMNTPPFRAENVVPLQASDPRVGFDREQFLRLTQTPGGV